MLDSTLPFSYGALTLHATGLIPKFLTKSRKDSLKRIREPTRSVTAVNILSTTISLDVPPKYLKAFIRLKWSADWFWLWVKCINSFLLWDSITARAYSFLVLLP